MHKLRLLLIFLLHQQLFSQPGQLKLDYFPLEVIADFYHLKGVKEVTVYNTLIEGEDTVIKKEAVNWFKYEKDSVIAWMQKEFFIDRGLLSFAHEQRYEGNCLTYRNHSYTNDPDKKGWSKTCRGGTEQLSYHREYYYFGNKLVSRKEMTNTLVNKYTRKLRWREWQNDKLMVDSSQVQKITRSPTEAIVHAPPSYYHNSESMTRNNSGKPIRYSKDWFDGIYQNSEAWDYVYKAGDANAWRVDYSKSNESFSEGPEPLIFLENYQNSIPTHVTYVKKNDWQNIQLIVEVAIK